MQLTLKDFGELLIELDATRKEVERLRAVIVEMEKEHAPAHKEPAHRNSSPDKN